MLTSQPQTPGSNMSSRSLTTSSNPSTPKTQTLQQGAEERPSPGTWRHPKFDEITRRQKASTFSHSNLRRIGWNGATLVAILYCLSYPSIYNFLMIQPLQNITTPLVLSIFLVLLYNISVALLPLTHPKDDLTDIPLTPTQRALLGLDPNATPPPTPGTQYITPPRYARSPTPRNISATSSGYGTPISRKGSPRNETPSSSPLWQKTRGSNGDTVRRQSSGTPSPLGLGLTNDRKNLGASPGTPSPRVGRGTSVALNSKWLYERGRSSSAGGKGSL